MSATLYTPQVLSAAVGLASYGWDETLPRQGQARSRSCGSTLAMGLGLDAVGAIAAIGLRPHACAIGQAAAHVFATAAIGRDRAAIATARAQIEDWLTGSGDLPDWPGFALLEPARAYPARHGAILLAWDAALAALDSAPQEA